MNGTDRYRAVLLFSKRNGHYMVLRSIISQYPFSTVDTLGTVINRSLGE